MKRFLVKNKEQFEGIVDEASECGCRFVGNFFKSNGKPFLEYPFIILREDGNLSMIEAEQKDLVDLKEDIRSYNVGNSDYSKHKIQPWQLWIEYKLNPFDADIVKRVLRHKKGEPRRLDYEKIIHVCKERIRQIDKGEDSWSEEYKD